MLPRLTGLRREHKAFKQVKERRKQANHIAVIPVDQDAYENSDVKARRLALTNDTVHAKHNQRQDDNGIEPHQIRFLARHEQHERVAQ